MGGWWVEEYWSTDPVFLVSWVVWILLSITLHELGHGWAAIRCGDRTPIETGHMTWNPIVHMGPASLIAFAFFGFAWGTMPVSPSRFRGRYDDFIVSGAGPAINVGLALVSGLASALWVALAGGYLIGGVQASENLYQNMQTFLNLGCALNVALVILNLLPFPPLDGSTMLANLSPGYRRLYNHEHALGIGFVCFALVFMYGSDYLWSAGHFVNSLLVDGVLRVIAPRAI